jgi:hypothetical protein
MSVQPAAPHLSTPGDQGDPPGVDESFEFADAPGTPPAAPEDQYWYSAGDSAAPQGPIPRSQFIERIESGSISGQALVWRKGMVNWVRAGEHFGLSESSPQAIPQPPGLLPAGPGQQSLFARICFQRLHATHYRLIGRCCLACGILVLLLSFPLALLGLAWFAGGLQFLLIAAVLEIAGLIRGDQEVPG